MVRYPIQELKSDKSSKIILKIKGDGKKYQLRIKNNQDKFLFLHQYI